MSFINEGISTKQFLSRFERKVKSLGGVHDAAIYFGVSRPFVRNVLNGVELPGQKILKCMKLEPVKQIRYRYKELDNE